MSVTLHVDARPKPFSCVLLKHATHDRCNMTVTWCLEHFESYNSDIEAMFHNAISYVKNADSKYPKEFIVGDNDEHVVLTLYDNTSLYLN